MTPPAPTPTPDLDGLIADARRLEVRDAHAAQFVDELVRWGAVQRAAPGPAGRRWLAWFGLSAAAVAVVLVVVLVRGGGGGSGASGPVGIGARVAIVASAGAVYRVVEASAERTEIEVATGKVDARLFHGASSHQLVLRGGGVEARAIGTVYTLRVGRDGGVVEVHEGTVEVTHGPEVARVSAGATWPPGNTVHMTHTVEALLALAEVPSAGPLEDLHAPAHDAAPAPAPTVALDAAPAPTAPLIDAGRTSVRPSGIPDAADAAPGAPPVETAHERYARGRLLRSQGKPGEALAECLAAAGAGDPTWSPIALVEAARIQLGPLASPEATITLTDRFLSEWPAHELAPTVRELRCRALRQLNRSC